MGRRRNSRRRDAADYVIFRVRNIPLTLAFPLMLVAASAVQAAQWQVTPRIQVEQALNDNVFLAPPGAESSDRISQLNPGIRVEATGARMNWQLDYALQNIFYERHDEFDDSWHQLDTRADMELLKDVFFLDASAVYAQQAVSSDPGIPPDNASISDNRTNVATISLRPRLQGRLTDLMSGELSYAVTRVKYDNDTLSDSRESDLRTALRSVETGQNHAWALIAEQREIQPDNGLDSQLRRAGLELQLPLARRLRLLLEGGRENNEYLTGTGAEIEQGDYWYAGLAWQPSQRLSANARTGERFFGRTSDFSLTHRGRRWQWDVRYQEELQGSVRTFVPDTGIAPPAFDGEARPGSEVFLQKGFTVDGVRDFGKLRLAISIYDRNREFRVSGGEERVTGERATATLRVTPRVSVTGMFAHQDEELFAGARRDELWIQQLGAARVLWPGAQISFNWRYYHRDSTDALMEYRQTVYSLGFAAAF